MVALNNFNTLHNALQNEKREYVYGPYTGQRRPDEKNGNDVPS